MLKIKKHTGLIILLIWITSFFPTKLISQNQDSLKKNYTIKENLYVPFGTLVKLKIKIVDGNDLQLKGLSSSYLIEILEVDSIILEKTLTIEFKDESGEFPIGTFELYKMLYDKETGGLSSDTISKMNKQYVGKEFYVIAYETGKFIGAPNTSEYVEKYLPFHLKLAKQDYSFHFRNYIIIESKITDIE